MINALGNKVEGSGEGDKIEKVNVHKNNYGRRYTTSLLKREYYLSSRFVVESFVRWPEWGAAGGVLMNSS